MTFQLDNKKNDYFKVLAPMEGITDLVFRNFISELAPADIQYTEFTSAKGLLHPQSKDGCLQRLEITDHTPTFAQLWGNNVNDILEASKLLDWSKFIGLDINMGCPDKKVVKNGCGSGLILAPQFALDIINRLSEHCHNNLRLFSVKTRLGYASIDLKNWIEPLLKTKSLDVLTIHLRTKTEMSKVPAHFEIIPEILALRDIWSPHSKIFLNGDFQTIEMADQFYKKWTFDGVMFGRAILKNILLFSRQDYRSLSLRQQLHLLVKFGTEYTAYHQDHKSYERLKRFFKVFLRGEDNVANLRNHIYALKGWNEAREYLLKSAK